MLAFVRRFTERDVVPDSSVEDPCLPRPVPGSYYFVACFLPATVRRGPFRVREFVLVRCPRTGKSANVPLPAVAADVHQTLDVLLHVAAQIALNLVVVLDVQRDSADFFFGQVPHANIGIDPTRDRIARARCRPDAVNIRQRKFNALLRRNIDTSNAGHSIHSCSARPACRPRLTPGAACAWGSRR
jgi:hypothetical protein